MNRVNFLLALILSLHLAPLAAEEPTTIQSGRIVGSVYGKSITAADIGLTEPIDLTVEFDARDKQRWEQMGRIMQAFGKPISERFAQELKIDPKEEEIAAYKKNWREGFEKQVLRTEDAICKLNRELAAPILSREEKSKLEEKKAIHSRVLPNFRKAADRDVPVEMAKMVITARKIERELHKKYGGRVIFQQVGPEALDARRLLFEEAEKKGDLKFNEAGVRHLFYYYYSNMKHLVVDENVLQQDPIAQTPQSARVTTRPNAPPKTIPTKPLQAEKKWVISESSVDRLELAPNKVVPVDSGVWFGGKQPGNDSNLIGFMDLTEGHVTLLLENGSANWDAVGKMAIAVQLDRKSLVKLSADDKSVATWDKRPEHCQFFSQVVAYENHFCISSPYNPLWIFDTWLHAWQNIELKRVTDSDSEQYERSSPNYYRPTIQRFVVGLDGEFWAFQGTHDATRGNAVCHYIPSQGRWDHYGFPWAMARGDDHLPIGETNNFVWFAGQRDILLFDKNSHRWSTSPVSWPGKRSYHPARFTQIGILFPIGNSVKQLTSDLLTWEDLVSLGDDESISALAISGNSLILATSTGIHVLNKLDTGQYGEPKHYPWNFAENVKTYKAVFGLVSQDYALALADDLCNAATEGDLDRVGTLLADGADIEATTDSNGLTPLMLASSAGHLKVVELLLENGANLQAKDKFQRTALTIAAQQGHRELADYLLSQGAKR